MPLEISESLAWAHPVTAEWFLTKFGSPAEPQIHGWPSILDGNVTLISAPTGSGTTLAAFLGCIDQLLRRVRTVIVDEIHAVADDKRGAHLTLSLERLNAFVTGENRLSPGQFGAISSTSSSASRPAAAAIPAVIFPASAPPNQDY